MLYKALTSFSGVISMAKDEVKDIENEFLIKDLTRAGYIMPIQQKIVRGIPAKRSKGVKKNARSK